MSKFTVLGAGPAGLAAALELAKRGEEVTLLERNSSVGGNAGSFEFGGQHVDFGSHRLHPASDPQVLAQIRELLGDDLLERPRHGRINLLGRWIHFPLRPADLLLNGNPRFTLGVMTDLAKKLLPGKHSNNQENFATVLSAGLGETICNEFYFPYAKKIWGVNPDELSATQAHKRVSAGTIGKMIKRMMPWNKGSGGANTKGIFFYPRYGFGQICEAYYEAARKAGVKVLLDFDITAITLSETSQTVSGVKEGQPVEIQSDQIFSTIPVTTIAQLVEDTPAEILTASKNLQFRSMVLVYLKLPQRQFTEYDAHYFPGKEVPFTRVSEPRNYSDRKEPTSSTVLCVEVPCFYNDQIWNSSPQDLAGVVVNGIRNVGLEITNKPEEVMARKLRYAYPLYKDGYEKTFDSLDSWIESQSGILSFGRQGLYAHDNTHHAIFMAQKAVECVEPQGSISLQKWRDFKEIFKSHVVED